MNKREIFQQIRAGSSIPAHIALAEAQNIVERKSRAEACGFEWQGGILDDDRAVWTEQDFSLVAFFEIDELGWEMCGVEDLGRFTDQWQPDAIHHSDEPHLLSWFLPTDSVDRHSAYKRALSYGHDWSYLSMIVTASRSGVELGRATLSGLESDAGEGRFTEVAFSLADSAMAEATDNLKKLCGCH